MPYYPPLGVTDHGLLTGLADDDHTQYLLTSGTRTTTGITLTQSTSSTDVLTIAGTGGAASGTAIHVKNASSDPTFSVYNDGNVEVFGALLSPAVNSDTISSLTITSSFTLRSLISDGLDEAFLFRSSNTFTTGNLFIFKNNATEVYRLDYQGNLFTKGYTQTQRSVEANTAGSGTPNVLTAAESRKLFTNEGVTAKNYHTLPSAVAGLEYTFYCQDVDGIRATAASGDTIRVNISVSASGGICESTTIGSSITLACINATEWVATSIVGTWVTTEE